MLTVLGGVSYIPAIDAGGTAAGGPEVCSRESGFGVKASDFKRPRERPLEALKARA